MLRQRWSPRSSQGKIWAFSHFFFGTVRLRRPGWRRSWHFGYPASTEVVDHHQGRCGSFSHFSVQYVYADPAADEVIFGYPPYIEKSTQFSFSRLPKTPKRRNNGKNTFHLFSHSETAARWLMPNLLWWINVRCFLFWDKSSIASPNR